MNAERILVVDGNNAFRGGISSMLRAAGFCCQQARSGLEAWTLLTSGEKFALILYDLMMPDLDGIALLRLAKEQSPNVPVIIVTDSHDSSAVPTAIRNGAYDYLLKPVEREELLETVRRAILENRDHQIENQSYQANLENQLATRTEQLRTVAGLERASEIILEAFGDALAMKDVEVETHSKRVTAYSIAIARAMGLPDEDIRPIARGAFLHDIGKMAIPDFVLRKPGPLNERETITMQEHCFRGYQILRIIPFMLDAAELVYTHQERFDGTGYPRGLKSDEIPLGARIIAVANTADAVTSQQPYRPAQSLSAARQEIQRWSGRQFDPAIVSTFLSMPESLWETMHKLARRMR